MSLIFATQLSAIATVVLAVFAIVTGVFSFLAFRKQSEEVRAIERQVTDQEELTRQQAELLKVQSSQLELQSHQLDDQREANAGQAKVLKLQADELGESLAERKREAEQRRSAQAARVFMSQQEGVSFTEEDDEPQSYSAIVTVVNTSDRPIYDAKLYWHRGSESYGDFFRRPCWHDHAGRGSHAPRELPARHRHGRQRRGPGVPRCCPYQMEAYARRRPDRAAGQLNNYLVWICTILC